MDVSQARQQHSVMLERLREMGLRPEPLPGGQAATVVLPLSDEPFPLADGHRVLKQVRLSTVGAHRVKCLEPRCLFHLPLLTIADCTEAAEIEARIRTAWQAQINRVRRTRERLEALGIACEAEADGALVAFDLGVDDPLSRARAVDFGSIVLPGRGPLSGHPVSKAEERGFAPDPSVGSALDLQMGATTRLEQLAREALRRESDRRTAASREDGRATRLAEQRNHRVLLVGPQLAANAALTNSLRVRGYEVTAARSDVEAMDAFLRRSFELMLVDAHLGRFDGLELVLAIQTLAGVERLPVVIVDDRERPGARERAKEVGAIGYLVQPIDPARIAPGLARLLQTPRYRRYSRYAQRVAVRCGANGDGGFTSEIGRLGMFVCTSFASVPRELHDYRLHLPELGRTMRVEGETIYRRAATDSLPRGIGVRFHSFPADDEALLIEYLRTLEGEPTGDVTSRPSRS